MRKFGLIGYPLGHSFSKKFFTEKFLKERIPDCSYENFPIPDLRELPRLISSEHYLVGLNVTIPYKSEVIKYLNKVDGESAEINAVNVLKIKRMQSRLKLSGFNSDITGIEATLRPLIKPAIKKAIVLGTGGSSKAVCYTLKKLNLEYTLVSRNPKPGVITYRDIDKDLLKDHLLVINTTPLGMYPHTGGKPDIDFNLLTHEHVLFDLVYNPEETTFLKLGKERGAATVNGLKMLIIQAEKSWEIWNNDKL